MFPSLPNALDLSQVFMQSRLRGGWGGGVNRFSDRRISQKKLFGFWIWGIFYTDLINTADCGFI
jgi:hypothetical protein